MSVLCQLCKKEFESLTNLSIHLSHPKSPCKTQIKEYYDKYLRKPNEGICIYCGNETSFSGLVKGYLNNKCKHCRNNSSETKQKRKENFENKQEQQKIQSGYYQLPEVCELCKLDNIDSRFKTRQSLARHISQKHKTSLKEYYDLFFKKPNEGICPITNKPTRFKNLKEGYFKFHGRGNNSADLEIQKKKEETLYKNYGVKTPGKSKPQQRIENYKKTVQEKQNQNNIKKQKETDERIKTIKKDNKLQCQICGLIFPTWLSVTSHVKIHNMTVNQYYDSFFKGENEGVCPASGKPTTFISLKDGYLKYKEDYSNQKEIIDQIKEKLKINFHKKIIQKQDLFNIEIIDIDQVKNVTSVIDIRCTLCNNIYQNKIYNIQLGYGKCPICFPRNPPVSKPELELQEYIKTLLPGDQIVFNSIGLIKNPDNNKSWELGVYIPDKKIAIEFNGLYWHSENVSSNPVFYHIAKTIQCNEKNIQLIHIFEDEWFYKKEIVKSMLKHKLQVSSNITKIYARKCQIQEIDPVTKNIFLNENHIQSEDRSNKKFGLFFNNDLVAVMTFSYGNISRGGDPKDKTSWELSRYATKHGFHVVGGAGKLLKFFQKNNVWKKIYSYADLRISNGNLYKQLGFSLVKQNPPDYWYIKQNKRIHRFNLRKRHDEPKDIPEWKLRSDEGYYRIWDCGKLKYELYNQE